jgi:uncharacterized protein YndB with AHSA1/START domain
METNKKENKTIIIERALHASVAEVWKALTDIRNLKQWLPFFADFEPKVGFKTKFMLGPDEDHQYPHTVKVLEVVHAKKLRYSWDYGGISPHSSVVFELTASGSTTQLMLTAYIKQVPDDQSNFLKDAKNGWNHTANALQAFVETKKLNRNHYE